MKNHTPVILEDQERVMSWAKKLQEQHISLITVIEFLVSQNKTKSEIINKDLAEMRAIYNSKNQTWREQLVRAIILNRYRLENDIKEGQIVTNDSEVGFACNVDFETRNFELSVKKDGSEVLGLFEIDDFRKAYPLNEK